MYPITHSHLCIFSSFLASLSCIISSFISLSLQLVVLLTRGVSSAGRPSGLVQVEAGRADPPGQLAKGAGVQAAAAASRRADLCAHQEPGRTKASAKGPPPRYSAAKGRKQGPSTAAIPWNDPWSPLPLRLETLLSPPLWWGRCLLTSGYYYLDLLAQTIRPHLHSLSQDCLKIHSSLTPPSLSSCIYVFSYFSKLSFLSFQWNSHRRGRAAWATPAATTSSRPAKAVTTSSQDRQHRDLDLDAA